MTNTERTTADAPERPAYTHLAVFSVKTAGRAMGWARFPVALTGAPSLDTIAAMESGARAEYDTPSAVLVNLIPLGGA